MAHYGPAVRREIKTTNVTLPKCARVCSPVKQSLSLYGKHAGDGLLKFKIFFLSFSLQKPNVNYVPINLDYVFYFFSSANELFSVAGGGLHYL